MKIRYAIVLAALAVAFAAVSVWVFLSGGKNARSIRAKFRLGGMMLTVSSLLSMASCTSCHPQPTCYDQPMCYEPVEQEQGDTPSSDQDGGQEETATPDEVSTEKSE